MVLDREHHSKPGRPGPGREPGKLALIAGVDAAAARASVCARTGPNCREQLRWLARAYWKRAPERAEARRLQPGPPLAEGRAGAGHPGADWPRHRAGLRWAHATPGGPGKGARGGLGKPGSCCGQLHKQLPPFPVCVQQPRVGAGGALRPGRDQVALWRPGWAPLLPGRALPITPTIAASRLRASGKRRLLSIY